LAVSHIMQEKRHERGRTICRHLTQKKEGKGGGGGKSKNSFFKTRNKVETGV